MEYRVIAAIVACAWLAACGPQPSGVSGVPIGADALPRPRAGLWLWSSDVSGKRDLCLSGEPLSELTARPHCPVVRRLRTLDGGYAVETRCSGAGPVRRTWAEARGDFRRAFSVDIAIGQLEDHALYRYLGPCPPGRRPDDQP